MIDYYKVGDKSGRYADVDLIEKNDKIDVSGISSPQEIRNKKKIEYIPRTIRINEFTDAALKAMAEECEMSINNAIGAILDGYVNAHQDEIGGGHLMRERVLNYYLDRLVNELTDTKLSSEEKRWRRIIKKETEPIVCDTGDVYQQGFWRTFFNVTIYKPEMDTDLSRFEILSDKEKHYEHTFMSDFELYMPEKKWFTVMEILTRYSSKCFVLGLSRKINQKSMEKLVDVINNSKTNKTLVKNLTNALKDSDEPFRERNGSIWPWVMGL